MSHFIMIASDAGSEVSAFEVASNRLIKSVWPIYKGTRNRYAIAPGDSILVYLGGHKRLSQTIIARATVKSIEDIGRRPPASIDPEAAQTSPPFKILHLIDVEQFKVPIKIRSLLGKLSFLPDSKKWGVSLVGGCRKIPADDFDFVESRRTETILSKDKLEEGID